MVELYPCPSCGFCVFDEPSGSYDICPICGWADDQVQLRFPVMRGGANRGSLADFQRSILKEIPPEVRTYQKYRRAPGWRPLMPSESQPHIDQPQTRLEYFLAATDDPPEYYWRRKK